MSEKRQNVREKESAKMCEIERKSYGDEKRERNKERERERERERDLPTCKT